MTDEKQKPEEGEVTEEQLKDVSGGSTVQRSPQELSLAKQMDVSDVKLAGDILQGNQVDTVNLDTVSSDDEDG